MLASALLACAAPAADGRRASLEDAIQRWVAAVNARDADALSSLMDEGVELQDEKGTVSGRDAAIQALREIAARGKLIAVTRELTLTDDTARHVAALSQLQRDAVHHARGEVVEDWRRVDGEWKLYRRKVTSAGPGVTLTRPPTKEPALDQPRKP
jgi:ketosteroid isomerase-like protein